MVFVVTHKLLCLDCLCFPPSNVTLSGVRYVLVLLGSGCCVVEKQNNIESSSNLMRKIKRQDPEHQISDLSSTDRVRPAGEAMQCSSFNNIVVLKLH